MANQKSKMIWAYTDNNMLTKFLWFGNDRLAKFYDSYTEHEGKFEEVRDIDWLMESFVLSFCYPIKSNQIKNATDLIGLPHHSVIWMLNNEDDDCDDDIGIIEDVEIRDIDWGDHRDLYKEIFDDN